MKGLKFSKDFFWGASVSSHQVEGYHTNNWSDWEYKNAKRLAREASSKKGWLRNWEEIKNIAQDPSNYISGPATKHRELYQQDFEIIKTLNLNSFRFSIEWASIEPSEGIFNEESITFYHKYLDELLKLEIEPFVTIFHWSLPLWFENKGGFKNKKNLKYFKRFIKLLCDEYGDKVKFWITLNEPRIYSSESFLNGRWPPQDNSIFSYLEVLMNLRRAHSIAYQCLKNHSPEIKVGVSENIASYTCEGSIIDRIARRFFSWYELRLLKGFSNELDFIGLNYYFHRHIEGLKVSKMSHDGKTSDLGWDLYPQGIHSVLMRIRKLGKPIIITENGLADSSDSQRNWFIEETLHSIQRAVDEGAEVFGYLHWSLLDNFEWDSGFWPRFGLVEVDYKNFKRKIRKSALEYSEIIKNSK